MITPLQRMESTPEKEERYMSTRVFDGDLDPEAVNSAPLPRVVSGSSPFRQPSLLGDPAPDVTTSLLLRGNSVHSVCHSSVSQDISVIVLAHDLYSIALVEGVPISASLLLPLIAAASQSLVLYMIGFTDANLFDEGRWLEPLSAHGIVNVMKLVATSVAVFKISSEFQQAQQLCLALSVGNFQVPKRRLCGWWAVFLQYCMALFVLFVSLSAVLSGQNCVACIMKIFTVFVVIDMDNLAARFIEVFHELNFEVKTSQEGLESEEHRRKMRGGMYLQLCCMVVPMVAVLVLAIMSVITGQLPLTIVKHGYVSNNAAPRFMQTADGCCPPVEESRTGTGVRYNVFLLSGIHEQPPLVHWVAVQSDPEPIPPSSLQVKEGFDGDGNPGCQMGTLLAQEVQAHYWLQVHGFAGTAYQTLQRERLYHSFMPYNITLDLEGLIGPRYRVYFAAQNSRTRALSSFPVRSEVFSTSMCARHCASCDISGPGFCDRCNEGTYRTLGGLCEPCTSDCHSCRGGNESSQTEVAHFFLGGEKVRSCDIGECHSGYSRNAEGRCDKCKVKHCGVCDDSLDRCSRCEMGFGVAADNGTCYPCAHMHCGCSEAGGCDSCSRGWGLTDHNGTCVECDIGCDDCVYAHSASCRDCKPGFVMAGLASDDPDSSGTECMRCAIHCTNCSRSGPGQCDECAHGFGYNDDARECQSCAVPHCEGCADPRWRKCAKCEQGYGITPEGLCDSCGKFCELCDQAGKCARCITGYALSGMKCLSCADSCASCESSGPAKCDQCLSGFYLDASTKTCIPPSLKSGPLEI